MEEKNLRKYILILFILFFFILSSSSICYCTDKSVMEDVLESQKDSLGIGDFLAESKKYTDDTFR